MIRGLSYLVGLLYCFVWLRPPEIGGIALPIQRVLGWLGLAFLLSHLLLKGSLIAGPAARRFLRLAFAFTLLLLLSLVVQVAYGERFVLLYFGMDLSKYAAVFTVAYLCYYALSTRLVSEDRFLAGIMISGVLATALVFQFLALWAAGFQSNVEILAPSFGGSVGVLPTGSFPRLAGTTAEPQQLSVALLTPLLLMLSRERIRRWWPFALLTGTALMLSQSKFSLVSLLLVGVYVFMVYERRRPLILFLAALATPVAGYFLIRLPTFANTLTEGLSAEAFVERFQNIMLLFEIIREHLFLGIGPGQYGVFRGITLYGNPNHSPGYTPNMDFLKVFAELGVLGFLTMLLLLGSLVVLFFRSYRRLPREVRPRYLAFLLGAVAILLNMTIGYELLHSFFWINIGALLYLTERFLASGTKVLPDPIAT
jgi:hypothetical protein